MKTQFKTPATHSWVNEIVRKTIEQHNNTVHQLTTLLLKPRPTLKALLKSIALPRHTILDKIWVNNSQHPLPPYLLTMN